MILPQSQSSKKYHRHRKNENCRSSHGAIESNHRHNSKAQNSQTRKRCSSCIQKLQGEPSEKVGRPLESTSVQSRMDTTSTNLVSSRITARYPASTAPTGEGRGKWKVAKGKIGKSTLQCQICEQALCNKDSILLCNGCFRK